jgi:hypothetical protein
MSVRTVKKRAKERMGRGEESLRRGVKDNLDCLEMKKASRNG